jgi:hypothetical protein
MPFIAVDKVDGEFEGNGLFGLAPSEPDTSYVYQLFQQGQIDQPIVGLNYENPLDKKVVSQINFGYFDYGEVYGGIDGFSWLDNKGEDLWAVALEDLKIGDREIQTEMGGKMAIIDSGNTSI